MTSDWEWLSSDSSLWEFSVSPKTIFISSEAACLLFLYYYIVILLSVLGQ